MKRYKIIEIKENCINKECHITEYHDGYIDCDVLCKINNEACDEEHCNHRQLPLEGFTKEEMIEKIARMLAFVQAKTFVNKNQWEIVMCGCRYEAEAALNALLEKK